MKKWQIRRTLPQNPRKGNEKKNTYELAHRLTGPRNQAETEEGIRPTRTWPWSTHQATGEKITWPSQICECDQAPRPSVVTKQKKSEKKSTDPLRPGSRSKQKKKHLTR